MTKLKWQKIIIITAVITKSCNKKILKNCSDRIKIVLTKVDLLHLKG